MPPGHSSDTRVGRFLVLLECHWCGAQEKKFCRQPSFLGSAGSVSRQKNLLPGKDLEQNKCIFSCPSLAVSVDGVCALCTGASKDTDFMLAVTDFGFIEDFFFFFFETTSFSSCESQMFIWHSEKMMQKEEFLKLLSCYSILAPISHAKKKKKSRKIEFDFQHLHNRHLKIFYKGVYVNNSIEFRVL